MIVMYDDFDKVSPESTPLDAQKTAHTKQLTAAQELPSFPDKLIDTAKFTRPTSFTKAFDLAAIGKLTPHIEDVNIGTCRPSSNR